MVSFPFLTLPFSDAPSVLKQPVCQVPSGFFVEWPVHERCWTRSRQRSMVDFVLSDDPLSVDNVDLHGGPAVVIGANPSLRVEAFHHSNYPINSLRHSPKLARSICE